MRLPRLFRRKRGFTLVELLVVVAIIAVLAGLAFPAYRSAQDRARLTQCSSNLKQIATGLFAYAADNDGALPAVMSGTTHTQITSWGYMIWPYVYGSTNNYSYPSNCLQMGTPRYSPMQNNIFRCPATRTLPVKAPTAPTVVTSLYSYGLNSTPLGALSSVTRFVPIRINAVRRPAETAMVLESSAAYGDYQAYKNESGMIPHMGGLNVLYYDGHVGWLSASSVTMSSTATFWTGN